MSATTPSANDRKFYIQALKGEACQCERTKQRGRALCFACWRRLPDDMQFALYRPIGRGFEQAYDAACRHLNE